MAKTTTKTDPKPPEELEGEGLLAWHRLVARLKKLGKLDDADPELMVIWCEYVETKKAARRAVVADGFGAKHANGVNGRSMAYVVAKEMSAALTRLAPKLNLTTIGAGKIEMDELEL